MPPSGGEVVDAVRWLRRRLLEAAGVERTTPTRRAVRLRRRGAARRLVNEAEPLPLLYAHGFEVIRNESRSVADQVRLSRKLRWSPAPHGAGETNLMFADERCRTLEILEPRWAS